MSRSALLINRFIRLAGPLLFLLILSRIDLGRTAEMLRTVRAQFLLAAAILYPLLILLKSWRWHLLLRQQGVSYSLACVKLSSSPCFGPWASQREQPSATHYSSYSCSMSSGERLELSAG